MAELFGDRADFAIEAGIEPDCQTTSGSIWGHMCVWCFGIALGDLDDRHCGLDGAYLEFDWLRLNLDSLWDDELRGFDDLATWNFLDGLLYGYHGDTELLDDRTLEQSRRDDARWHRFNFLTNWGEQFDGYKSFLVCPPGEYARVLSRRLPSHLGLGVSVTRRGIVSAATEFTQWFETVSQIHGRTRRST